MPDGACRTSFRACTSAVFITTLLLLIGAVRTANAFTQVYISTAAPPNLEQDFLANATAQYSGKVIPNPLVMNTYTLKLYGPNPNFNPPPTNLEQALSLGATVYAYGFANGMTYQQTMEENLVGSYGINCSTPTAFHLIQTSTDTWNVGTCLDVVGTIMQALFDQSVSTPTVIPPEP